MAQRKTVEQLKSENFYLKIQVSLADCGQELKILKLKPDCNYDELAERIREEYPRCSIQFIWLDEKTSSAISNNDEFEVFKCIGNNRLQLNLEYEQQPE